MQTLSHYKDNNYTNKILYRRHYNIRWSDGSISRNLSQAELLSKIAAMPDNCILDMAIFGHGNVNIQTTSFYTKEGSDGLKVSDGHVVFYTAGQRLHRHQVTFTSILGKKLAPGATIGLYGCYTGTKGGIAEQLNKDTKKEPLSAQMGGLDPLVIIFG